jgi:hypothetical protein
MEDALVVVGQRRSRADDGRFFTKLCPSCLIMPCSTQRPSDSRR